MPDQNDPQSFTSPGLTEPGPSLTVTPESLGQQLQVESERLQSMRETEHKVLDLIDRMEGVVDALRGAAPSAVETAAVGLKECIRELRSLL